MAASYRFTVRGRVQGVGFRRAAVDAARRLGVTGWVRNRGDGAVEGVAAAGDAALQQFRRWLGQGPAAASVDAVDWQPSDEPVEAAEFGIHR